jgi:hypothetical protein
MPTAWPSAAAIRSLILAACTIWIRCPISAHAAASYGEQNPTGRSPGQRPCSRPTTGSRRPTAGNPLPSTSSDRIRATCSRTAPGSASPNTSPTTAPSGCRRHTPPAASSPSGTNARCRCPAPAPRYAAGENPSRNAAPASSENGPAGTSSKVVMPKLYQTRPTTANRSWTPPTGDWVSCAVVAG